MKRKALLSVLFLFFLAVAIFSGYKIIGILTEYRAGESTYEALQQHVELPDAGKSNGKTGFPWPSIDAPEETDGEMAEEECVLFPDVDFESLLEINDDVIGWIYIEDTNINYPVVQGENNDQYLYTMIDGKYNSAGSIFMDYRNQPDLTDPHTILYGHHMKNKTMFADITKYRDQAFYDAHPVCLFMTPKENYQLKIISAYVAGPDDPAWQLDFFSEEEVLQWAKDSMMRSGFSSAAEPQLGDRFITLSTCSYEFNNARFVLIGVLNTI